MELEAAEHPALPKYLGCFVASFGSSVELERAARGRVNGREEYRKCKEGEWTTSKMRRKSEAKRERKNEKKRREENVKMKIKKKKSIPHETCANFCARVCWIGLF